VSAPSHGVRVELGERSYDVCVGAGLLDDLASKLTALGAVTSVMLVTNPTVRALYGATVEQAIEPVSGKPPLVIEIRDGERFKNLATLESIYDTALDAGVDRGTLLIALGGGVVGDLAGFAAATLLRGIRVAMLPTTLLAQVDASVGGKTGVNRRQGKNLVGAFHQPSLVLADTLTLATLPAREYRAGLAEVVKYGMILDSDLFALLETRIDDVTAADATLMTEIVARSVELKAGIVERDETESGLRAVLNFGHTVGHAIEQATGYTRYLHGEAVAIGMVAAVGVSVAVGNCDPSLGRRLEKLLAALGLEK